MTGPNESDETRPISVAELLARNGTIGAPPVGGRRRRRRGNTDAVTVAELTGEIPVVRTGEIPVVEGEHGAGADTVDAAPTNGEPLAEPEAPEFDDYIESIRGSVPRRRVRAEQMSPDPIDVDDADNVGGVDIGEPGARVDEPDLDEPVTHDEDSDLPSYLRGQREHLFGGSEPDLVTAAPTAEDATAAAAPITPMGKVLGGAWIVLQSIIAVAFGAGLFLGFDQLWKWNNIVALVLSVLVILGLVVTVRIVRKTEDIGSTLIAVAVGALVTLGPLALLQSN
jgi:hypothetical protein